MAKFKVLLYNLKCGLCDWRDFNLASSEKIAKSPNFNPSQNFYFTVCVTINYKMCYIKFGHLHEFYLVNEFVNIDKHL